jgi:hypothetical protein
MWLAVYLLILTSIIVGVFALRERLQVTLSTPQARADWEMWRKKAGEQSTDKGPVQRRIPRSAEPPALVLLRDHFAVVLSAAVLFGSLLFAMLMFAVRGVFASGRPAKN